MLATPAMPPSQILRLRDYQEETVERLRESMRRNRRVLLQLPTGGGKTAIASFMAQGAVRNGRRVYFNCHRAELVEQTSLTWRKYGIAHGYIAANRPRAMQLANICSIDTLKNRLHTTPEPDVCIWDEAHHLGAAGWQMVMDAWKRCRHIGLSATPWRLDGRGLGRQFDDMVEGPSAAWLMDHGHLSRYDIYAPNVPDMTGTKRVGGDYNNAEASKRMDIPKRFGDILVHWRRNAEGMRTVGFAVNRADSAMIVERFNSAGIAAAHLDGDTPDDWRRNIIRDFARKTLYQIWNVALFGEGFDLSAIAQTDVTIDCLIDAAPTQSLAAVLQRWGRVLRAKDYPAVINDHAGNSNRHGFPDDEREWTLADRERTGKGGNSDGGPPPPFTCKCFRQLRRPLPSTCPHCGVSLAAEVKPVEEGEGELKKLTAADKAAARARLKQEENEAKTIHELADLARRRGYKNPQGWAFKKWSNSPDRQRYARRQAEQINALESA
jgi:superfamily II DNA or RNA helicase